ncbi:MAG: filamentous hemagglutinin N-terminal domain-containing protein, partial [Verrucomicrobiota bacterium]|nr:filamentous hemagglutinin N-terminal domain-containing protein [Verrucomicrobiota bacterium]
MAGSARFDRAGKTLQITTSDKAVIHWQDFSIGEGARTRFIQPGAHSAALNRVVSGLPSNILGDLEANGKLFLINPNGVLIGPGARIDTAGFLASTLDVSDAQFLAGGDLDFLGSSTASIVNQGTINAIGGDVFLIARSVENSGAINAPEGTVGLAAGQDVLLKQAGDERLFVRPGTGTKGGTGVTQSGRIAAAAAELKASGNLYALAINHSGVTRATGAVSKGGRVFLTANGGSVQHSGQISARKGSAGGRVQITGRNVALTGAAVVDASGEAAGGEILIGGDFQGRNPDVENAQSVFVGPGVTLNADGGATLSGAEPAAIAGADGGRVIVWSDGATEFHGSISARALGATGDGGFVEISGKQSLGYFGLVDLRALGGRTGTLLLDPID